MNMIKLLILLSVLRTCASALPTCQPNDFHYEYTACDSEGGRWRVQVPKPNTCEGGAPHPPVRGKSCDFTCEKGQYLDISSDQECKPCSPGTYSLGDGARFEEWDKIPNGFTSTAETFHYPHGDKVNCTMHKFEPKGSYISALAGECNSQLSYSANLVKHGSVMFEYQYASDASALFHFTVQNDQCESSWADSHTNQWPKRTKNGQWTTIEVDLKSGLNVLKWRVIGMTKRNHRDLPVLIRRVEITGIGYTSACTKCRNGTYSSGGTQTCTPCPENTYALHGASTCKPCDPTSEYSLEGASACIKRPACTKEDYYEYQLPCNKGKTQINYRWISPQICRTDLPGSVSLPPMSASVDCPPCNPGMYLSGDSVCKFCPEGQYSDGKTPCQDCPGSTSPDYQIQHKWWNTMPLNMTSDCARFAGDDTCRHNSSWIPMGDHLHSHFGRDENAYLLLVYRVSGFRTPTSADKKQVVGSLSFVFSTTCEGSCAFVLITALNGPNNVQKAWDGSQDKTHYKLDIHDSGPATFSWAFQRSYHEDIGHSSTEIGKFDIAKIYSITVTNAMDGAAVGCKKCPKGKVDNRCVPCPAGHYIDPNTTTCEPCPQNTIIRSPTLWGQENCKPCGKGLKVSEDGTECVTDCTFTDKAGRSYDFKALNKLRFLKGSNLFTGSGTKYYHGFNISLCGDQTVTCIQNITTDDSQSDSNIPTEFADAPVRGVVCRSTIIPSNDGQKSLSTQPTSLGDYITKVASNQSLKELYEKGGFKSEGSEKDIHFYSVAESSTEACPKGRSTIISLRCDIKLEGDGEIHFPPRCVYGTCDGCNFHFLWKTMYACPKCSKTDFSKIVGECSDGSQMIHYSNPGNCIGDPPAIQTQKCAIKFPFIVKVVVPPVAILGIVLLICVMYCWHKNKNLEYKYMKLKHGNEPNYDGELPGVDSCALSDGEEDQFDSVQFKESRGSKFFSKLRGKKSKDDENPFETGHSEKIPLT